MSQLVDGEADQGPGGAAEAGAQRAGDGGRQNGEAEEIYGGNACVRTPLSLSFFLSLSNSLTL